MNRKNQIRNPGTTASTAPSEPGMALPHATGDPAEPPAPTASKSNILFIMTDQQRFDCLGANGNSIIRTPNLDRLAAQSANFSHAFIQSPVCTPSRACFFTGRYSHAHKNRVNYTELDENEILLPEYLQQAGYRL